jgi:hypothetical protein
MGNFSQIMQESAPANSVYNQSYVGTLRQKWAPLLEGVGYGRSAEHQKNTMAVLFENQTNFMMQLDEDTRSTNVGSFMKYVFPV